jgi:hypothetical protein
MPLTHNDFWCQILWSSAEGVASILNLLCEAKVCNLKVTVASNQQVFRLEVSVRDLLTVQVFECQGNFGDVKQRNVVGEDVFFSEESEDLAALHEVKDQVQVDVVLECF